MPEDVFTKSVTRNNILPVSKGGVIQLIVPMTFGIDRAPLPPEPPAYWSLQRDMVLRTTVHKESMWAAAVGIAITKIGSLSWEIRGEVAKRIKDNQELFINADGTKTGWVGFISKHLRDYITTDNGAFVEIVRASKAKGSKIVGIKHLDSLRVTRTGDPDIPVLYRDKVGRVHELRDHQIFSMADMEDPSETWYGVGLSAASRAYFSIYKLAAIENFIREKVGGLRPLAIHIVNGVLDTQLKDSVKAAQQEASARGLVGYMGAVIIGIPDEIQPALVTIPLAELPTGFTRKEEFDIAVLTYADVLGLDPQELQPLTGGAIGTGSQSLVLQEKARGKGLVAWKQSFTHLVNNFILPDKTVFAFTERDYRDIGQRADISNKWATVSAARIGAGITTPEQELQVLIDRDELPKEFAAVNTTGEDSLTDTEKPNQLQEDAKPEEATSAQPEAPGADKVDGELPSGEETEGGDQGKGKIVNPNKQLPGRLAPEEENEEEDDDEKKKKDEKSFDGYPSDESRERARFIMKKIMPAMISTAMGVGLPEKDAKRIVILEE